ncbi:putative sodium-coupled neutral amino acid transporter 10 isoform X2 [Ptychodera flava]|uniref:putative sodium-coupled neutral amino acid transporter 10 isoform X2 n=1 Tax=Ptychodera flava TaxID=63121 RepID=UPI003969F4F9
MAAEWIYVLNLGNSIIGVSVLAMPYCLRQCGLILGLLLLLVSAYLTRISCNLLLKTAKQARRTSYEYLALHSFGSFGKLAVETSIIGLLMGTCIAFYVIIGDLGPSIVSKWFSVENTWSLRTVMLMLTAVFVVLPLGLLRKVEQLSSISALSFSFYTVLIAQIILISFPTLLSFSWVSHASYWRTEGLFQCLSIFSLAFTCHTQVFVVYESLPDRTERKMNDVVKGAVNMVAFCYIMVGFFGYVAFCEQGIKGDVLMNFKTSFVNDLLKMGFVISVALSFPMMIFPCRASINTLISGSQGPSLENPGGGGEHIPQGRHQLITSFIVFFTLIVGIAIPNVETILGLTGSTTGTMIGYIFPALMFLKCLPKGPGVKSAQMVLFIGIIIMFASTYSTLQSRPDDTDVVKPVVDINIPGVDQDQLNLEENKNVLDENQIIEQNLEVPGKDVLNEAVQGGVLEKGEEKKDGNLPGNGEGGQVAMADGPRVGEGKGQEQLHDGKLDNGKEEVEGKMSNEKLKAVEGDVDDRGNEAEVVADKRQEPPIPHAPADSKEIVEKPAEEIIKDTGEGGEKEKREEPVVEEDKVIKEEEQIQGGPGDRGPDGIDLLAQHGDEQDGDKEDDDEAHRRLEEKVEMKVKEQDIKHEEQQKMIDELKEKQDIQEKIIEQQQEVIEVLKKQHDGGSMELAAGEVDAGVHEKAALQENQQPHHQQHVNDGNPAAVEKEAAAAANPAAAAPVHHGGHHQVHHHDAAAAAAVDNLGQPQLAEVKVVVPDAVAPAADNAPAGNVPVLNADNQHQPVHDIKLPPADLNPVGLVDTNVKALAPQPQPRDILGVEGQQAEKEDGIVHKPKDTVDDIIQNVEKKDHQDELHNEHKESNAGHAKKQNGHHGNKNHEPNDDKVEREKRDLDIGHDIEEIKQKQHAVVPDPQLQPQDLGERRVEDQEKVLYEDHLEILKNLNQENEHIPNVHAGEMKEGGDAFQKEMQDDLRNVVIEENLKVAEPGNNQEKNEHLRKEEVRR